MNHPSIRQEGGVKKKKKGIQKRSEPETKGPISSEPQPSTSTATEPETVASSCKLGCLQPETVEESSEEDSEPGPSRKARRLAMESKDVAEDFSSNRNICDITCLDSEPGPSRKARRLAMESKDVAEDFSSNRNVCDIACLQSLITASGTLCPQCQNPASFFVSLGACACMSGCVCV